jgi:hypothetical protein
LKIFDAEKRAYSIVKQKIYILLSAPFLFASLPLLFYALGSNSNSEEKSTSFQSPSKSFPSLPHALSFDFLLFEIFSFFLFMLDLRSKALSFFSKT